MAFTVVHTDPPRGNTLADERGELERVGARLVVPNQDGPLDVLAEQADAVLNTVLPLDAAFIGRLSSCRVIVRTGVGVDNVDVEAATERGIVVACVPDASIEEVSNHALALLLALSRKIARLDRALRAGVWDRAMFTPMGSITGQTLGLVGFGRIARALAAKAAALHMSVLAHDPLIAAASIEQAGVEPVSLEAVLQRADFVSLHVPLAPDTRHLIDNAALERMKPSAFLINTARGPLVDQAALLAALRTGAIAGAGLDVYEQEPLAAGDPLLQLDNVVLTPHSAAFSDKSVKEIRRRSGEAAADVLSGLWPRGLVNPNVMPRWPLAQRANN